MNEPRRRDLQAVEREFPHAFPSSTIDEYVDFSQRSPDAWPVDTAFAALVADLENARVKLRNAKLLLCVVWLIAVVAVFWR